MVQRAVSSADCSPERLMQLVREGGGHGHALDQITRCYSERLLEAGRRHCRTGSEAKDAVQDALVVAAEHLPELQDDSSREPPHGNCAVSSRGFATRNPKLLASRTSRPPVLPVKIQELDTPGPESAWPEAL